MCVKSISRINTDFRCPRSLACFAMSSNSLSVTRAPTILPRNLIAICLLSPLSLYRSCISNVDILFKGLYYSCVVNSIERVITDRMPAASKSIPRKSHTLRIPPIFL